LSDDFDDFIKRLLKSFNLNGSIFDLDFFLFPESLKDLNKDHDKDNVKGFKISYHYEPGMEKPEIKVEGEVDEKKIKEYLKENHIENVPGFNMQLDSVNRKRMDAGDFSLEDKTSQPQSKMRVIEPYSEINQFDDHVEIILEVPGVERKDVLLSFNQDGNNFDFSASNKNRKYYKHVDLPFKISKEDYGFDLNNGIAIIKIKKE